MTERRFVPILPEMRSTIDHLSRGNYKFSLLRNQVLSSLRIMRKRRPSRKPRGKSGAILRAMGTRTPRGTATTFGEEFGERLKAKREERGFTLEELADKAGMHSGRLSEYESGRHTPQLEKAAKLAEVLEVALDELVGLKAPEVREDVRNPRLRASVRALEASGHSRYIEAAGLAVEGFVALARHDEFEAVRPRRRK